VIFQLRNRIEIETSRGENPYFSQEKMDSATPHREAVAS
jgi:hypothetical protein